jgi:hypothetical protein
LHTDEPQRHFRQTSRHRDDPNSPASGSLARDGRRLRLPLLLGRRQAGPGLLGHDGGLDYTWTIHAPELQLGAKPLRPDTNDEDAWREESIG